MYEKILIPLDGSDLAEQALPHAVEVANAFGSDVHIVHIVMRYMGGMMPYEVEYQLSESLREAALHEAHEYLNRIAETYKSKFNMPIHTKVIEGVVSDAILDFADFQGIDLIVMATHGRSGVSRWVFGSVAERVLRASKCPVFLIRAASEEEDKAVAK
jgi:nucleotide-binding universal stress UspA family protein